MSPEIPGVVGFVCGLIALGVIVGICIYLLIREDE